MTSACWGICYGHRHQHLSRIRTRLTRQRRPVSILVVTATTLAAFRQGEYLTWASHMSDWTVLDEMINEAVAAGAYLNPTLLYEWGGMSTDAADRELEDYRLLSDPDLAYFPEFPNGLGGFNGRGVGDFEVDYHDTAADWELVTAQVRPVAIITFSRATTSLGWELEPAHRRFAIDSAESSATGVPFSVNRMVSVMAPQPRCQLLYQRARSPKCQDRALPLS